jgi:hypothetical protein
MRIRRVARVGGDKGIMFDSLTNISRPCVGTPVRSHWRADTPRDVQIFCSLQRSISRPTSLRLRHLQTDVVGVVHNTSILGAPVSGLILDNVPWLGVSSWRWLLVLEGQQ